MNEDWKSRDYDGRYDRFVSADGEYTLIVQALGYKTYTRKVKIEGPTELNIVLKKDTE